MVLRIPILYGDVEYLEESAVTVLFKKLKELQGQPEMKAEMSDYEIRRPSHVNDIATVCHDLLLSKATVWIFLQVANSTHYNHATFQDDKIKGIYQWVGKESMTKYAMVKTMAEVFNMDTQGLVPNRDPPPAGVQRPYNSTLSTERLDSLGIGVHTKFADGIKDCLKRWF